jgi:phosphonatase-like hydrolase
MSKQIRMVVFDMAGTTVNENNVVYKTLRKAIDEAGFDFNLDQVLAEGAGKEKRQAIETILSVYANVSDAELTSRIYDSFIVQLTEAYTKEEILPQNHATEVFAELKQRGILTVLNTGYDRATAQSIIDRLGWKEGDPIDGLVTASDVPRNRPNPDMIQFAMQRFGITDSMTVAKVGDSAIDIEEGKNAGCGLSVGITTGAHTVEQLQVAKPDYIIGGLWELVGVLG